MSSLKIIRNDQDHEQAVLRLMGLMDSDLLPGSEEEHELEVLALLIEDYEKKRYPIDPPDPIEAILFRMEQQELRQKDLIPYIGSASKVNEVLNKKRPLSLNMIRRLSEGLGISADVLIKNPEQKFANHSNINWQAFPLAEMNKRGYFGDISNSLTEIKEYAAEYCSRFLSSVSSEFSIQPSLLRSNAQLRSNNNQIDYYALWAWQIRILQKAQTEQLSEHYSGTLDIHWMRQLVQLSWSDQGPLLAKEFLNKAGIHLVFEPHFPKTYLDGAVLANMHGNPIVALTLRHDRLDNFWFTLCHELAHVALHLKGDLNYFVDDLDSMANDQREIEADMMAQTVLVPKAILAKTTIDINSVRALAKELNIAPDIIAGYFRHTQKDHKLFGTHFRSKVKHLLI